jgi:hypothetical protein
MDPHVTAPGSGEHDVVEEAGDESEDALDDSKGFFVALRDSLCGDEEDMGEMFDSRTAITLAGSKVGVVGCIYLTLAERMGMKLGSTTPKDEEFMAPAPCRSNCSWVSVGRLRSVCWFATLAAASHFDDVKMNELSRAGGVGGFGGRGLFT